MTSNTRQVQDPDTRLIERARWWGKAAQLAYVRLVEDPLNSNPWWAKCDRSVKVDERFLEPNLLLDWRCWWWSWGLKRIQALSKYKTRERLNSWKAIYNEEWSLTFLRTVLQSKIETLRSLESNPSIHLNFNNHTSQAFQSSFPSTSWIPTPQQRMF